MILNTMKLNGESIKINMKSLYESLFDIDDNVDNVDRSIVEKFLKDNYRGSFIISNKPNKDGKYEVSCVGAVVAQKNITSLTNDMFVWTEMDAEFNCSWCDSLTSLKGAPKKVGSEFNCMYCKSLMSLKGAPKKTDYFRCEGCGGKFSEEDVKKVSDVKGFIVV